MSDGKMVNLFCTMIVLLVVLLVVLSVVPGAMPSAYAAEGGYSNYIPGLYGDFAVAVAPEPGFYLRQDLYYYMAEGNKSRFVQGGELRADLDLDMGTYMVTGFYATNKTILGGRYAFGADLPIVYGSLSGNFASGSTTIPFDDDRIAIGDPGIIPVSLFWSFGNFHLNAYESIIVPIGSYDKDRIINGGLNYWTFDTVLAATYLHPEKGFELSATLGYIYNTENDDTDYQTGQEFHLDYMLNQFLSETFALGIQGFYYKQTTGDSGSGALLGDFKGEAAGIGPALMWATKIKDTDLVVTAKWLHEFHAEHRLEGDHLFLNLTLAF